MALSVPTRILMPVFFSGRSIGAAMKDGVLQRASLANPQAFKFLQGLVQQIRIFLLLPPMTQSLQKGLPPDRYFALWSL